ncbi:MAG TPA: class 1 fructose-bisphosphatase, partial [Thermoanaerobaculia bacterium]
LLVYTCGDGVHLFTLDPGIGEFLLTRARVTMPPSGKGYAVNEGRAHAWTPGVRAFVEKLKAPDPAGGRGYATRYSASLVADVHRFLLEGGIYLYPGDAGDGPGGGGKLRVLYECHPLAFVVEQAGGRASTGTARVLDIAPTSLHERMPLAIGSRTEVELFETYAAQA